MVVLDYNLYNKVNIHKSVLKEMATHSSIPA